MCVSATHLLNSQGFAEALLDLDAVWSGKDSRLDLLRYVAQYFTHIYVYLHYGNLQIIVGCPHHAMGHNYMRGFFQATSPLFLMNTRHWVIYHIFDVEFFDAAERITATV